MSRLNLLRKLSGLSLLRLYLLLIALMLNLVRLCQWLHLTLTDHIVDLRSRLLLNNLGFLRRCWRWRMLGLIVWMGGLNLRLQTALVKILLAPLSNLRWNTHRIHRSSVLGRIHSSLSNLLYKLLSRDHFIIKHLKMILHASMNLGLVIFVNDQAVSYSEVRKLHNQNTFIKLIVWWFHCIQPCFCFFTVSVDFQGSIVSNNRFVILFAFLIKDSKIEPWFEHSLVDFSSWNDLVKGILAFSFLIKENSKWAVVNRRVLRLWEFEKMKINFMSLIVEILVLVDPSFYVKGFMIILYYLFGLEYSLETILMLLLFEFEPSQMLLDLVVRLCFWHQCLLIGLLSFIVILLLFLKDTNFDQEVNSLFLQIRIASIESVLKI